MRARGAVRRHHDQRVRVLCAAAVAWSPYHQGVSPATAEVAEAGAAWVAVLMAAPSALPGLLPAAGIM